MKSKSKGVKIITISEPLGIPTVQDFNNFFGTMDAVGKEMGKAAEVTRKALKNITDRTQWIPDVLPQAATTIEKMAVPFGGPQTPPWGHNGLNYNTEKWAVDAIKRTEILDSMQPKK